MAASARGAQPGTTELALSADSGVGLQHMYISI
jgi:hypothetical protein